MVEKSQGGQDPEHMVCFAPRQVFVSLLFLVSFSCDHLGLDRGLRPLRVEKAVSAEECQSCHREIVQEWKSSRHRVAYTNTLYQESFAREKLQWCQNCHLPMILRDGDPDKLSSRLLLEEGVNCQVCHLREGKVLVSRLPSTQKAHDYTVVRELGESEFCAHCHQFPFPVGTGAVPHNQLQFSQTPMQNTFEEWKASRYYPRESCQDCHMEKKDQYRTHRFPGGHDFDLLQKTFSVESEWRGDDLLLVLTAKRLGHGFPTGDLFRSLEVRIVDSKKQEIQKQELNYRYKLRDSFQENESAKILVSKNTIPGATDEEVSRIRLVFSALKSRSGDTLFVELRMRYLALDNSWTTSLPESAWNPRFATFPLPAPPKEVSPKSHSSGSG